MRPILLLLLLFSHTATAYPIAKYLGFGLGYTWTESSFNEQVRIAGGVETPTYGEVDNGSHPFSLYGGFRFHPNYGLELGYMNYGSIEFEKTLTTTDLNDANDILQTSVRDAKIETSGFLLSHVFYFQLLSSVTLQAKAGVLFGNHSYSDRETLTINTVDAPTQTTNAFNSSSDSFASFQIAASALYRYSPDLLLRLQLNQIEFDHDDERETFTRWFTQLSFEYQL